MNTPIRIQRKRTAGWKMPPNTVYVGRPGKFGNPIRAGIYKDYTAADAVRDYKLWLKQDGSVLSFNNVYGKPPTIKTIKKELKGKNLACWCKPGEPCHADVLLKIANS